MDDDEIDLELDIEPQEVILHCKVCDDPCVRTVLGSRQFVHYDELVTLAGRSNYDHECEVPLRHPEVLDVKTQDALDT